MVSQVNPPTKAAANCSGEHVTQRIESSLIHRGASDSTESVDSFFTSDYDIRSEPLFLYKDSFGIAGNSIWPLTIRGKFRCPCAS